MVGAGVMIVVVADHREGRVSPVTYELLTLAAALGAGEAMPALVVVLGDNAGRIADLVAERTGFGILAVENRHLTEYQAELYFAVLSEVLPPLNPRYVLIGHTSQGMDYGPALAVGLDAACITAVEGVGPGPEGPVFKRAIYNGKMEIDVRAETDMAVVTVQPGSFPVYPPGGDARGDIRLAPSEAAPESTRFLGLKEGEAGDSAVTEADVLVAGGRGLGKRENLVLLEGLARMFSRSAVAGSRPVCDLGWLPYSRQVGLTGATVTPKLYIACGISGARQHTAGMRGSGFIVAVSTDPEAAIFSLADVYAVEDISDFIPVLVEEMEKKAGE